MFERFTDRARRVVVLAQEEARRLNHNYIGTEHILLGLIQEGEGHAAKAIEELSYTGRQGEHMVVVENTPEVHNVVVCTLCSCYPWPVLGIPPTWYKSDEYRSRTVREPREVLQEFGLELDLNTQIKVWDSTSEMRYLVLPMRPVGTEHLSENELESLVTRNSMIGTGLPEMPK